MILDVVLGTIYLFNFFLFLCLTNLLMISNFKIRLRVWFLFLYFYLICVHFDIINFWRFIAHVVSLNKFVFLVALNDLSILLLDLIIQILNLLYFFIILLVYQLLKFLCLIDITEKFFGSFRLTSHELVLFFPPQFLRIILKEFSEFLVEFFSLLTDLHVNISKGLQLVYLSTLCRIFYTLTSCRIANFFYHLIISESLTVHLSLNLIP